MDLELLAEDDVRAGRLERRGSSSFNSETVRPCEFFTSIIILREQSKDSGSPERD